MKIDDIDRKILNILLNNSRLSFREIARKAKVSPVTALNRINRLNKNGLIKKYSAILDYEKLGYDFQVAVWLTPARGKQKILEKKLADTVDSVFVITGDYPIMAIARFMTKAELELFLNDLSDDKDILSIKSEFITRSKEGVVKLK